MKRNLFIIVAIFIFSGVFADGNNGKNSLYSFKNFSPLNINTHPSGGSRFDLNITNGALISGFLFDSNKEFLLPAFDMKGTKVNFHYSYGIHGEIKGFGNWSYRFGVDFQKKGLAYYDTQLFYNGNELLKKVEVENSLKLNYVTLPFLFRLEGKEKKGMYLIMGPYLSFTTLAKDKWVTKVTEPDANDILRTSETTNEEDISTAFTSYDIGVCVGFGGQIPILQGYYGPTVSLFFEERTDIGVIDIYDSRDLRNWMPNDTEESNYKIFNLGLMFSVGIQINI